MYSIPYDSDSRRTRLYAWNFAQFRPGSLVGNGVGCQARARRVRGVSRVGTAWTGRSEELLLSKYCKCTVVCFPPLVLSWAHVLVITWHGFSLMIILDPFFAHASAPHATQARKDPNIKHRAPFACPRGVCA